MWVYRAVEIDRESCEEESANKVGIDVNWDGIV